MAMPLPLDDSDNRLAKIERMLAEIQETLEVLSVVKPKTKALAVPKQDSPGIKEVFDYWVERMGKQPKTTKLSPERAKKIGGAIAKYDVQFVKDAVDGCAMTKHNMGINDDNKVYNDIELICRSAKNVERFNETYARFKSGTVTIDTTKPLTAKQEVRAALENIHDTSWLD